MIAPVDWDAACRHLESRDPEIASLISHFPGQRLSGSGDAFQTLANAIVGQQISIKAASAIWGRLVAATGVLSPDSVLACDDTQLRAAGLSVRKVEYLKGLASAFGSDSIERGRWPDMDDEDLIQTLVSLRGIGRWTAEMFLIFHMQRPDLLPLDDVGLLRAAAAVYGWDDADRSVVSKTLMEHAERWRPYRTVATWYLWRLLDSEPVVY